MFNFDDAQYISVHDNRCAMDFIGESNINYAEVSRSTESMTVGLVTLGDTNAIFINQRQNYHIPGVADDIDSISYRSGFKGWMYRRDFNEKLRENKSITKDFY